ncbi:GNAT family N-acetyltransferase [Jeotgalibacillus salarius]|uniref:GNAT family N-acetyltransferase n=1 Tax=Jeotgalibacillus salarius TaxID=546023 RepID=A0A4Y8LJ58_9BACL|nr:GNAT family N-acetyltransferase [Jeotgalibacillus salarius]TFE02235.1 GNAT family N-acetyltransferase [Jeotgalibacillus salarius]
MIIRELKKEDLPSLDRMIAACQLKLISNEKIEDKEWLIEKETERLCKVARRIIESDEEVMFVAVENDEVIGSIACMRPGELITCGLEPEEGVFEVGSIYIHPGQQRKGIGRKLLNYTKEFLYQRGQSKFYLDAGFVSSQTYWKKRLGEPDIILENYWGGGFDHMIWIGEVKKSSASINK